MPRVSVPARTPVKRRYGKRTNTLQRTGEATNNTGSLASLQKGGLSGTAHLARADILVLQNTAGNKAGRDSVADAFKEVATWMDSLHSKPEKLTYDKVMLYRTIYDQFKQLVKITADPDLKNQLDQHKKPSVFFALKVRHKNE